MIDMPRRQRAGLFSVPIKERRFQVPIREIPTNAEMGSSPVGSTGPLALIDYYDPDSGFSRRVAEKRSRS